MAQPCTRTYTDDVTDALALLASAAKEIVNWQAHLDGVATDPTYARALGAQNSALIVQSLINEATCDTHRVAGRLMECTVEP